MVTAVQLRWFLGTRRAGARCTPAMYPKAASLRQPDLGVRFFAYFCTQTPNRLIPLLKSLY